MHTYEQYIDFISVNYECLVGVCNVQGFRFSCIILSIVCSRIQNRIHNFNYLAILPNDFIIKYISVEPTLILMKNVQICQMAK